LLRPCWVVALIGRDEGEAGEVAGGKGRRKAAATVEADDIGEAVVGSLPP